MTARLRPAAVAHMIGIAGAALAADYESVAAQENALAHLLGALDALGGSVEVVLSRLDEPVQRRLRSLLRRRRIAVRSGIGGPTATGAGAVRRDVPRHSGDVDVGVEPSLTELVTPRQRDTLRCLLELTADGSVVSPVEIAQALGTPDGDVVHPETVRKILTKLVGLQLAERPEPGRYRLAEAAREPLVRLSPTSEPDVAPQ